jgi:recombinational DNA repair ATPase RecF
VSIRERVNMVQGIGLIVKQALGAIIGSSRKHNDVGKRTLRKVLASWSSTLFMSKDETREKIMLSIVLSSFVAFAKSKNDYPVVVMDDADVLLGRESNDAFIDIVKTHVE